MSYTQEEKQKYLERYVNETVERECENIFTTSEGRYFLVLDGAESNQKATEEISETCGYFRSHFLAETTGLPESLFRNLQKDNADYVIYYLIDLTCGMEEFVDKAVAADGYGLFLSHYDGEEIELAKDLYAYEN